MIQRTLFNKLTLDRIDEVFVPSFRGTIESQMRRWREAIETGETKGKQFYISITDTWEMDGILLYDANTNEGVLFARTRESVANLLERARRDGEICTLTGDPTACRWAQEMDFPQA